VREHATIAVPHGDPGSCRLVIRHADGTTAARDWVPDEWPPEIGQLVTDEQGSYRIAAIRREGPVTVIVALPAKRSARRLLG
jgi:hypothetical protein